MTILNIEKSETGRLFITSELKNGKEYKFVLDDEKLYHCDTGKPCNPRLTLKVIGACRVYEFKRKIRINTE
jgi:hypothetical protein